MNSNIDIIIGLICTMSFAIIFSMMMLVQRSNAMKSIVNYRCYMITWISYIPALISCILLNRHLAEIFDKLFYIIGELIVVFVLTLFIFILLIAYDLKSLPKLYGLKGKYSGAPKMYILITALASAMSMTALFGWVIAVAMGK